MEEGSACNMNERARDEKNHGALKEPKINSALLEDGGNLGRE